MTVIARSSYPLPTVGSQLARRNVARCPPLAEAFKGSLDRLSLSFGKNSDTAAHTDGAARLRRGRTPCTRCLCDPNDASCCHAKSWRCIAMKLVAGGLQANDRSSRTARFGRGGVKWIAPLSADRRKLRSRSKTTEKYFERLTQSRSRLSYTCSGAWFTSSPVFGVSRLRTRRPRESMEGAAAHIGDSAMAVACCPRCCEVLIEVKSGKILRSARDARF
jgi:hypothetical protein